MLAKELSYELSIRLGDPVPVNTINADADGVVFTGDQKLRYISRAYSKLTRLLKILMRDYQPEFNKRRRLNHVDFESASNNVVIGDNVKIDELFVHYSYKGKDYIASGTYMEPSKYLTNKYDPNDVKSISFETGKIKYTLMVTDSKWRVYLLPEPPGNKDGGYYKKLEFLEIPDFRVLTWEDEVPITGDYVDLLIDLAAIQGMQDIARADKAQLIERSIQADWQILGQYGTYMKQTEGVKE